MIFLLLVYSLSVYRLIFLNNCIGSPASFILLQKRGNSGKQTPPHQSTPEHLQRQPTLSFGSFQELLKLDPKDLMLPSENDSDHSSATSHFTPKPLRGKKGTRTQLSPLRNEAITEKVEQPKPTVKKRKKRAEDYNLKRRLKRAELKANDPISYRKERDQEAEKSKLRRKKRKELALKPFPSGSNDRAAIRKRVREGKGTEKDKEYLNQLRIKNQEYRKRKKQSSIPPTTER